MEHKAVQSSNIESLGYDAERKVLEVKFRSGSLYQYEGVEQKVYDALLNAPSPTQYLNSSIKGSYAYKKV